MNNRVETVSGPDFSTKPRGLSEGSPLRMAILGGLLVGAMGVLGYQLFDRIYIPAYGDTPEVLDPLKAVDPRMLSADDLTSLRMDEGAFAEEVGNLDWRMSFQFDLGDGVFERPFRTATQSTYGSNVDGLGPLYNAKACESCHANDGRTEPVPGQGLLVRLSVPGTGPNGGAVPHPVYGGQFADVGIDGVPAEGFLDVTYEEFEGSYGDGTPYTLRKPVYTPAGLNYGPMGEATMMSPRAPLSMHGLGLLEAIPEETLAEWADPDDLNGDGISGKINRVWDPQLEQTRPGRFGWKSETPSIAVQSADAAHNDMGVTTPIFPNQACMHDQTACNAARTGADPETDYEMTGAQLESLRTYLSFLAVPARGHLDDATVIQGEKLFNEIGCASCHMAQAVTGNDHDFRRLRNKTIQPFTDLLLHDMGPGLSDNRPSYLAEGREWRTAPLWGIGLLERTNNHLLLLHDGRARGFAEAILWHGGEAEAAREAFRLMTAENRQAIINFLKSL